MTVVSSMATGSLALITLGSVVSTLDSGTYIATGLYAYSVLVLWRLWTLRAAHPDAAYALNTRYFLALDFVLRGAACFFFSKPGKSGAALVSRVMGPDADVHPVFMFLALGIVPLVASLFVPSGKQRVSGVFVALSGLLLTLGAMGAMYIVNVRALVSVVNAWPLYLTAVASFAGIAFVLVSQLAGSDMMGRVGALALTVAGFVGQIPVGGVKDYTLYDLCPAVLLLSAALIKSSLEYVEDEEEEGGEEKKNSIDNNDEINENAKSEQEPVVHSHPPMDIEDFFSAPKEKKTPTKKVSAKIIKRKTNEMDKQ